MFGLVAKAKQEADVLLHGDIGRWGDINLKSFMNAIEPLRGVYKEVNLRIHCGGGSVIEGIAVFNYILAVTDIKFNAYIDGVCASMMSIVILACDNIYMAENTRLMIHQARRPPVKGTASEYRKIAEELEGVNKQMAQALADRTGKEVAWIQKHWLGEHDTWLTADKAKEHKIVDGTYKSKLLAPPTSLGSDKMVAYYDNQIFNTEVNSTMKDQLIALLALAGFAVEPSASADDTAFMATFTGHFNSLVEENEKLKAQLSAQEGEGLLAQAVVDRKITQKQADNLKPLLATSGIEAVKNFLGTMSPAPVISQRIQQSKEANASNAESSTKRENWTFDDFQRKDPKALLEIKNNDPEAYAKLKEDYLNA